MCIRDRIAARVENIARLMGLSADLDRYPSDLSTSTEQQVVIGRAFAMNPDLLLMDEPYGQMLSLIHISSSLTCGLWLP